jgi:branched-chain amino acid transport system permease protein
MFSVLINQFWSLTIAGLALGFIYVLISLGYTMVYGVLRMINFANSEIFMWGTFGTIIASRDIFHFTQTSKPATGFRSQRLLQSLSSSWPIADCAQKEPIDLRP